MQAPSEADKERRRRHMLSEVGWNVWFDETDGALHGEAEIIPQLLIPGQSHLRTSMLAAWADHLMGLLATRSMAPRVPVTLELDVHLYAPAPGAGVVRGVAEVVKDGRSVFVAKVRFLTGDGVCFAVGAGSFMLAADPNVRLPSFISLDVREHLPATLKTGIAERAECVRQSPGVAVMPRREDGVNASKTVHGGLLAVVAEEAVLSLAPESSLSSLSLRYLRPLRVGPVVATARMQAGLADLELVDAGSGDRLSVAGTARVFP